MAVTVGIVRVLIASPLELELVDRIAALDARLEIAYRPDLLARPRYYADHSPPITRTAAQEAEWATLLAQAEVMFDVYRPDGRDLPRRAPRLRWIQFTSSGVGHLVERMGLAESPIVVTTAAGIHAAPLAEFVLFAMLYFAKRMPRVLADQRAHRWERFAGETLRGATVGVVGLGRVGREVARVARAAGMRVVATRRSTDAADAAALEVDVLYPREEIRLLLGQSDYVVLIVPLTAETAGLIGEPELAAMKPGAVLVNMARGAVVDEPALIRALGTGHLGGAALDVFAVEPLPPESPLWDLPNVLVTPHSMSTAAGENALIADLFRDNLRHYLAGQPLRNVFDRLRGY